MVGLVWLAMLGCGEGPPPCGELAPSTVSPGPGGGGNLLVVLLDDVGTDEIGRYGEGLVTAPTPTIDCLCDRGVRFTRAWGAPLCSPGRAALATGRLADRTGIGTNVGQWLELPLAEETLGEVFGAAGYQTGWIGKWHLDGWRSEHWLHGPLLQGFDVFSGTLANLTAPVAYGERSGDWYGYWHVEDDEAQWRTRYATSVTVDDAVTFVRRAEGPWLMVLALHAAHEPLEEPPGRLLSEPFPHRPSELTRYRAILEAADTELGRLLQTIDPEVLADTTVVLTSDNGTSWEGTSDAFDDRVKGSAYEGGIRVPMVVSGPHVAEPGTTSDALVHLVDLMPTFGELVGIEPLSDIDGVSFVDQLLDPSAPGPDFVTAVWEREEGEYEWAVRDDRYKLIHRPDLGDELYDLGDSHLEDPDLLQGTVDAEIFQAWFRLMSVLAGGVGAPRYDAR